MSDVTNILNQIESGDPSAAEQLLPLIYDELHGHTVTGTNGMICDGSTRRQIA